MKSRKITKFKKKGGQKLNNLIDILKKPIGKLNINDCYQLAKKEYVITKSNNNIIIRKSN